MALTNWITGIGMTLATVSGELGCLLLFAVVWFPMAGSLKMNANTNNLSRNFVNQNTSIIQVEDGNDLHIWNGKSEDESSDLALGMSMGDNS